MTLMCPVHPVINRSDLIIASWNPRELNKLVKLRQVLCRIKQMKSNMIFPQETHLVQNDISRVGKGGQGKFTQLPLLLMLRGSRY